MARSPKETIRPPAVSRRKVRDGAIVAEHITVDVNHPDQAAVREGMKKLFAGGEQLIKQRADAMGEVAAKKDASQGYATRAAELYRLALGSLEAITEKQARFHAGNLAWRLMHAQAAEVRALLKGRETEILAGVKSVGAQRANAQRRKLSASKIHERWQRAADELWHRKPRLSKADVARAIAPEFRAAPGTIRLKIAKPKLDES